MEEKKLNSAINKAENIADNVTLNKNSSKSNKSSQKNNNVSKAHSNSQKKVTTSKNNGIKNDDFITEKEKALILKQQKEEEKAKMRIAKAESKKQEKENKEKDKKAKRQAEIRKRESLKALKIKQREERKKRRDILKHESKEQRAERKLREKDQIKKAEREKAQQIAKIKADRIKAKEQKRKEIAAYKMEKKNASRQRGLGGWITAVSCLGVLSLALGTVLVWNMFMPGNATNRLSSSYSRNFYELVDYVDNMDVNLSKLQVSEDNGNRQKILADIMIQANLAEENLSALPLREEQRNSTMKFINQLGDFSKYLNNKIIDSKNLDERDVKNISEFKKINTKLKDELDGLCDKMGHKFNFSSLLTGEEKNIVLEKFNELEYNSVEYPKMIYDGPFSDKDESSELRHKKQGKKISEEEAISIFNNSFSSYNVKNVKLKGSGEGKFFNVFNLEGKIEDNQIFAQISEFGDVVMFNILNDCNGEKFNRDQCVDRARESLSKLGYRDVKPVWTTTSNNMTYINFASFNSDGVIFYSDLIKVGVCTGDGMVCDMDASQYVENHKERKIDTPLLRVESAEKKICSKLSVKTSRLALIPLFDGSERLAYEFYGVAEDGDYYVYIDALNGRELKIFKVIENSEGTLLL